MSERGHTIISKSPLLVVGLSPSISFSYKKKSWRHVPCFESVCFSETCNMQKSDQHSNMWMCISYRTYILSSGALQSPGYSNCRLSVSSKYVKIGLNSSNMLVWMPECNTIAKKRDKNTRICDVLRVLYCLRYGTLPWQLTCMDLLAIWLSSARKFENPHYAITGFYLRNTLLTKLCEIIQLKIHSAPREHCNK